VSILFKFSLEYLLLNHFSVGFGHIFLTTLRTSKSSHFILKHITKSCSSHRGNSLNLATCSLACVLALVGVRYVYWENGMRERGERDYRLEGKTQKEIDDLRARHPAYRYQP